MKIGQDFFGDGAGGHSADGFPGAGPTAAARGADAVFGLISQVGVRRSGHVAHFPVVARTLVAVFDPQCNRGPQRKAVFHAGQDGHLIRLIAFRGQFALARAAPVELGLDFSGFEFQPGGAAIDHGADGRTVRFAEGGDPEKGSEGAGHVNS